MTTRNDLTIDPRCSRCGCLESEHISVATQRDGEIGLIGVLVCPTALFRP